MVVLVGALVLMTRPVLGLGLLDKVMLAVLLPVRPSRLLVVVVLPVLAVLRVEPTTAVATVATS
jgi:hypothetical protein